MGAQGGQAASTFVERDRVLWKIGAKRSFSAAISTLPTFPRFIRAAIPMQAGTDERGEEPNPVPLVRGSFQAARGHEADESTSRIQRIIVRKNQAKSLRHRGKPNDDLLSIRRGTSHSNREIMAKTQSIQSRASTDRCGVPVPVEVCCNIACVNLR